MDIPYRGDSLQPSRDRVSAHWKREGWRYARGVARLGGYAVSGAVGLAAAGLQNFLQPVPDLDTRPDLASARMDVDMTQPRYSGLGRKGFPLGLGLKRPPWYARQSKSAQAVAVQGRRAVSQGGVAGGSTWQGRFRGRKHRGTGYVSTVRGFTETVKIAGYTRQLGCTYLGISSYPYLDSTDAGNNPQGSGKLTGRVFKDICVALVRHYFRHFHTGRLEFTTPEQSLIGMLKAGLDMSPYYETMFVQYSDSVGNNITDSSFVYMAGNAAGTYDNIRSLGNAIAIDMFTKWRQGLLPRFMYASRYNSVGSAEVVAHGRLALDQVRIRARCVTVLRVQNQSSAADVGANPTGASSVLDVDANPLQGKIFYFKRIGPTVATAQAFGSNNHVDNFGQLKLTQPIPVSSVGTSWNQAPYLENIYASGYSDTGGILGAPTGAWATLPKAAYFKNCVGEKVISMEPGVMKQFALRFRFSGKLTDWLRADATNFAQADTPTATIGVSGEFSRGMGQCALLVVEKRIRDYTTAAGATSIPIQLAFECDTYIHADVSHSRARMANHVEIGYGAV